MLVSIRVKRITFFPSGSFGPVRSVSSFDKNPNGIDGACLVTFFFGARVAALGPGCSLGRRIPNDSAKTFNAYLPFVGQNGLCSLKKLAISQSLSLNRLRIVLNLGVVPLRICGNPAYIFTDSYHCLPLLTSVR